MASVALQTCLLAPLSDLSQIVELEVDSLSDDDAVQGEVRTYAGGRQRAVRRAGTVRQFEIECDVVNDRALIERLRQWRGQTLLLRDPWGRKAWVAFFGLPVQENIPAGDWARVRLRLQAVTHTEAV